MQPDPEHEGRRWLDQALRDMDDARLVTDAGRFNLACFLCQQGAEKALKGFLFLRGEELARGHSVGDLCKQAAVVEPAFASLCEQAARLDLFYIPTRYPNGLPGGLPSEAFAADDADRALGLASSIIERVERAFSR
jgi:HEPN domain-containing protein